jgi:hypothetical protein
VAVEWKYRKGLPKSSERDYRHICQELREYATSNDHFALKEVLIGRLPVSFTIARYILSFGFEADEL